MLLSSSKPDTIPDASKFAAVATKSEAQDEEYITYSAYTVSTISKEEKSNQFLLDTGVNTHLSCDESLLCNIKLIKPVYINGIAGTTGKVIACKSGPTVVIKCTNISGAAKTLEINNVLLVPEAGVNLIAVLSISGNSGSLSGNNKHVKIVNHDQHYVIRGVGTNGLYKVKACRLPSLRATPACVPADVWHL